MRYSVHPSRAFRNRIAKSIGVLVAAALIATLGLPSAAHAQTIKADGGIVYTDMVDFTVNWVPNTRLDTMDLDNWIVTLTKPNGDKVVVDQHTTNPAGTTLGNEETRTFNYNRNDAGTWWFQVDACFSDWGEGATGDGESDLTACPDDDRENGTAVGYTHGPFPAPKNLAASLIPTGVALTWTSEKSDHGFVEYQYSMNADAAEPVWEDADASGIQPVTAMAGDYTFSVRALGESDNDRNTMEGDAGAAESMGMVASVEITVPPTPTPTLPEIAALFLAMLLLGSGAYLLRRRQSGGLTHA